LDGGAEAHDFVGTHTVERTLAKEVGDARSDSGDACGSSHDDDLIERIRPEPRDR
jgi:hypothetical protein